MFPWLIQDKPPLGTVLRTPVEDVTYANERLLTYSFLHFYSFISAVLPEFDLIPIAQESSYYSIQVPSNVEKV